MPAKTDPELPPDSSVSAGASAPARVGVLGLGRAGLDFAAAIAEQPGLALSGLVDARAGRREFARAVGFPAPVAVDLARLLVKTPLDAVVVCAHPEARAEAIEAASAAGLAVLVDGLPAPGDELAARLTPLLTATPARVWCGLPALLHPLFVRSRRLLAAGAIGTPRQVRASAFVSRVFAPGAPPAHGDVLDFAVAELLALVDAQFGPARAVSATGHTLYGERLDEAHATLTLADGSEVGLDASWSVPGYPRASLVIEAEGDRGTLLVSDDALEVTLTLPCDGLPTGTTRRVLADEPDSLPFDLGDVSRVLAAFAGVLAGREAAPLAATRGLRVARLLGAMRRSLAAEGAREEVPA